MIYKMNSMFKTFQRVYLHILRYNQCLCLSLLSPEIKELSLTQAIRAGLVESTVKPLAGQVVDKDSGEKKPMDQAIKEGLVDRTAPVVYDPRRERRISIDEAIRSGMSAEFWGY